MAGGTVKGGFRRLVHPATVVTAVDLADTRQERDGLRSALHRRQELLDHLLSNPDSGTSAETPVPGSTT